MTRPHRAVACLVAIAAALVAAGAHAGTAIRPVVRVTAGKPTEFAFTLSTRTVKRGTVTFKVVNAGAIGHDFVICPTPGTGNTCRASGTFPASTDVLNSGASTTLTYTFKRAGLYEYLCSVAGHAAAGMKGQIRVT